MRGSATVKVVLAECLDPQLMRVDLEGETVPDVLRGISNIIAESKSNFNIEDLYLRFIKREEQGTTAIGSGIALPHARVPGAGMSLVGMARLKKPMVWGNAADGPVWLVVFSVVDQSATAQHIQIIGRLSRILRDDEHRAALQRAKASEDLFRALNNSCVSLLMEQSKF